MIRQPINKDSWIIHSILYNPLYKTNHGIVIVVRKISDENHENQFLVSRVRYGHVFHSEKFTLNCHKDITQKLQELQDFVYHDDWKRYCQIMNSIEI